MPLLVFNMVLVRKTAGLLYALYLGEVHPGMLLHSLQHTDSCKRLVQVNLHSVPLYLAGTKHLVCHSTYHVLGNVHHAVYVCVCLVELQHGKLRVMHCVHTLISEISANLIHSVKTAYNQALQVQFQSNAQIHIYIQGVVMGNKWPGRCASRLCMQHRSLNLQKFSSVKISPYRADYFAALYKHLSGFGIHNKVQISLTVAGIGICEAVVFLRQW